MFIVNNINKISNRLRLEINIRNVRFLCCTFQSFTFFTYRPGNVNVDVNGSENKLHSNLMLIIQE